MTTIAVHRSAERSAPARGRELGAARAAQLHATWDAYERLLLAGGATAASLRDGGLRALERIEAWAPSVAAELSGVAEGSGLEPWRLGALNARTELLAPSSSECSTFVSVGGDGPPRTIQTWDWHEHLHDAILARELVLEDGRVVRVFTEAGIAGKIGVNDAGLGVHFNILQHARDGGPVGVPVHVVARRILDEAVSLSDAVALARSAEVSASSVITVVTRDGALGLELSPAGVAELRPDADGVLVHSNHFLDPGLARGEANPDMPDTRGRVDELARRAARLAAADTPAVRAAELCVHEPALCCHPAQDAPFGERWATLATIVLDVARGHMHVHRGGPCEPGGWLEV